MADDTNYRPIKRIRQACRNCRRKKARCSGEHPICAFCRRLSQHCDYSDDDNTERRPHETSARRRDGTSSEDSSGREDFNIRLAAIESKLGVLADTMNNIASALQNSRMPLSQHSTSLHDSSFDPWNPPAVNGIAVAPPLSPFTRPPPIETQLAAADVYFRYCHNQPYSLFHEENFRSKLVANEVPQHLLFAFLASAVRYSEDPYYDDKIDAIKTYAMQSWKAMVLPWNGIENDAGISTVQTILLLAIIDYTDGKTQGAWIKVGLAIRIAQDFRLMLEPDPALPPVQQEERRRVFWSFYIADKLISCGRERPPAILDENCKVQLPCDEVTFRAGQYRPTATLAQVTSEDPDPALSSLCTYALTTVVASTLGRCAQYTLGEQENQGPSGQFSPWSPKSKFSAIHSTLLQLESNFGLGDSLTDKIKRKFTGIDGTIDQHRGAPLVFAYALFYLCQCLLYHPFLLKQRLGNIGTRAPFSFVAQAFDGCKSAATSLSKIMDEVKALGCQTLSTIYDPFYGYCTMVAGTIHALFSHSPDAQIVEAAKASLVSSMQNLEELTLYWKSCSFMIKRLESFHENSSRFASLIDPQNQLSNLSEMDIADLVECLDYSRLSTTARRQSQEGGDRSLVSNLPSPFFDDFLNLLPLGNSRPGFSSTNIDFADFAIDTPSPQLQHHQSTTQYRPISPLNTTVAASTIPSNQVTSDRNGDSNSTLSHISPSTGSAHSQLISQQHHSQNQQQSPHQFFPQQMSPVHELTPSVIRTDHVSGMSEIINRSANPIASSSSVTNKPYRRLSSHGGKRPWYEQEQQPASPNEMNVNPTLAIGQMIH